MDKMCKKRKYVKYSLKSKQKKKNNKATYETWNYKFGFVVTWKYLFLLGYFFYGSA